MKFQLYCLLIMSTWTACKVRQQDLSGKTSCLHTAVPPAIDGKATELCWKEAPSYPIDQVWSGKLPYATDYMGRFKACWDSTRLYLLIEIADDSLINKEDRIDIYIGNVLQETEPMVYSVYTDATVRITHPSGTLTSKEDIVKSKIDTQDHLSVWEIAISLPGPRLASIPFAVCYNDMDKIPGTPDRMGNVILEADPKKSRDVIYADDLGLLVTEVKEHK